MEAETVREEGSDGGGGSEGGEQCECLTCPVQVTLFGSDKASVQSTCILYR